MRARYASALLGLGGLLAVSWGLPVRADELADVVAPSTQARNAGKVGVVAGHALGDPAHPTASPVPYEGVSVLLLPYSVEFDSELDDIKAHFRDSLRNYMAAATDVASARAAYESALVWAGGGQLVRGEVTDARGFYRLTDVPSGEWMLLAWREEVRSVKTPKLRLRETKGFRDIPMSSGHSVVTYWWMRLQVTAGETASVDLTDRNVWIAAVREDFMFMQGVPATKTGPKKKTY